MPVLENLVLEDLALESLAWETGSAGGLLTVGLLTVGLLTVGRFIVERFSVGGVLPGPRLLLRAALPVFLLGGCFGEGRVSPSGGDMAGTWVYSAGSQCRQTLHIHPSGSTAGDDADREITHRTEFFAFGAGMARTLSGIYTITGGDSREGLVTFEVQPADPASGAELLFCGQYEHLESEALDADLSGTPAAWGLEDLTWRVWPHREQGAVFIGSADAKTDVFVMGSGGGVLKGFRLDDGVYPDGPLFFKEPLQSAAALNDINVNGFEVHPLPGSILEFESTNLEIYVVLSRVWLHITSALTLTLEVLSDDSPELCSFIPYQDLDFTQPSPESPFAAGVRKQSLIVNPVESKPYLVPFLTGSEPPEQASWILPLLVAKTGTGECQARIYAEPLAVTRYAQRLELFDPGFALWTPYPSPLGLLAGVRPGQEGSWSAISLENPGLVAPGFRLLPGLFQAMQAGEGLPDAGLFDPLDLLNRKDGDSLVAVQERGGEREISVYPPDDHWAGVGPWSAGRPGAAGLPISLPADFGSFPLDGQRGGVYAITLGVPSRVSIYTSGGVDTAGALYDSTGWQIALGRGGAADGRGFLLNRTLASGGYRLEITAPEGEEFSLYLEPAPPGPVADEDLEGCLLGAGLARSGASELSRLACQGRGVISLAGLESFTGLREADLSWNRVADLTPLAGLGLTWLNLDGNPLADTAPLASLQGLLRLSLAQVRLDDAQLSRLELLARERLVYLNLRGATGFSPEALSALRRALPAAHIIAPDGSVME